MVCTIAVVHAGGERYYLKLAREDYYLSGGEKPGRALGKGAELVGLTSPIVEGDRRVKDLFRGINPADGSVLRKGAQTERIYRDKDGRERVSKPVAAYDFTLSVDKTVSVLWAVSDRETQQKISSVINKAFDKVAAYIDEHFCFTRVRTADGRYQLEKVAPLFLVFEHSTSRELDPQKHGHLLLVNSGLRANGQGGAIHAKPFLQPKSPHRAKLTEVFHEQVGVGLERELGVETYYRQLPHGRSVAIAGVPPSLVREFSKRREEIEKAVTPGDTSKQVQTKVLATRQRKVTDVRQEELFGRWQETAREFGFDYRKVLERDQRQFQQRERTESQEERANRSESTKALVPLKTGNREQEETVLHEAKRDLEKDRERGTRLGPPKIPSTNSQEFLENYSASQESASDERTQGGQEAKPSRDVKRDSEKARDVDVTRPAVASRKFAQRQTFPQDSRDRGQEQRSRGTFERERFRSFREYREEKREERRSRPVPPRRPLSEKEARERTFSFELLKAMKELRDTQSRESFGRGIDKAFRKTRESSKRREKRYQRKQLFLYATGQISHAQYVGNTKEKRGLSRTKFGINFAYATRQISRKQQRYLLLKYGHTQKFQGLPRTRVGINFAYATYQITSHQRLALLYHHKQLRAKDVQTPRERAKALLERVERGVDRLEETARLVYDRAVERREARDQQQTSPRVLATRAKKREREYERER